LPIYKNPVIKKLSNEVFDLDRLDFIILGQFAKKGDTFRSRINLAELSDRQTSRRIDVLYDFGFLYLKKTVPYRKNSKMHHRETKVFSLSLKGFIASLDQIDFEKNHLTKKYVKEIKDKKISKAVVEYLKDDLIYFLTHNDCRGITLNKMKNVVSWFDDYNSVHGFSGKDLEKLNKLNNKRNISWKKMKKEIFDNNVFHNYVDLWYEVIDQYANGWSYDEIIKKISTESPTPNIEVRNRLIQFSNGHITSDVDLNDLTNMYKHINEKTKD